MRIRKRQAPLPFSSISPLSDPNFNRPPVTVVQLPLRQQQPPPTTTPCSDDPHYYPSFESDHPNQPIGQPLRTQARDSSAFLGIDGTTTTHGQQLMKNTQDYLALNPGGEDEEKNNDSRKKNVLGAQLGSGSSSSYCQAIGRWGEGEKAFPLKKRRGSVETRVEDDDDDDTIMAKETSNKRPVKSNASKNMKTKLNKKLVCNNEDESKHIDCTNVVNDNNANSNGAKKRGRGGALMEGSRCSRINGRGWRCCQQTLVGYSLCEHHLGKGRLRSISSVRNRAKEERPANNIRDHQGPISSNSSQQLGKQTKSELQHHNDGEEQKPLMMTKKRVKLGMVKARSMSSLMGQNDNAIGIGDDSN